MRALQLLLIFCAGMMLAAVLDKAYPHSWYDRDCCDDKDCRPARPDEVVTVPGGFLVTVTMDAVTETHFFTKGDPKVRFSQDGRFHVCVNHYGKGTPLSWYCLYVPGGGA